VAVSPVHHWRNLYLANQKLTSKSPGPGLVAAKLRFETQSSLMFAVVRVSPSVERRGTHYRKIL
jgi:hypothetical protein